MSLGAFFFSLQVDEGTPGTDVMVDLAAAVLRRVGYASPAVNEMVRSLRQVLDLRAPDAASRVQFQAGEGVLQVIVAGCDGDDRRISFPLP